MTTHTQQALAGPLHAGFWREYAVHLRPYLMFVSGITGLVGLSTVGDISPATGFAVGLAFFLSYGFGQALTDCFQTDTDSISSPYRPLVRGTVRREDVLRVSLAGLIVCGAIMVVGNPVVLPLAALGVVGLATYTYFKRRWWAGPFYNAWIVAVLYLIAVLDGAPGAAFAPLARPEVLAVVAVVFFGYANFVLAGYFKDVSADRATGYDTLPVRYGLSLSAWVSDGFAAVAIGGAVVALSLVDAGGPFVSLAAWIAFALGLGATVLAQLRLHRVRDESEAHRAINPVVHAYILLLVSITIAQQPGWTVFLVVFYAAFCIAMWRRPATQQI